MYWVYRYRTGIGSTSTVRVPVQYLYYTCTRFWNSQSSYRIGRPPTSLHTKNYYEYSTGRGTLIKVPVYTRVRTSIHSVYRWSTRTGTSTGTRSRIYSQLPVPVQYRYVLSTSTVRM